jgi:hypothetical protein
MTRTHIRIPTPLLLQMSTEPVNSPAHPLDHFLNHYTSVMHAKNLLMNLKKNYNIKDAFLDFCRRAERDQLHERDPDTFRFVIKTFFCWHMAKELFKFRKEIQATWEKDYAASQEAYKAFDNHLYKAWYDRTYDIKLDVLNRAYYDYLYDQKRLAVPKSFAGMNC